MYSPSLFLLRRFEHLFTSTKKLVIFLKETLALFERGLKSLHARMKIKKCIYECSTPRKDKTHSRQCKMSSSKNIDL